MPAPAAGPSVGSLFSGYGGLDMGVADAIPGARVAWHAEIEPAACRVLEHRFPGVPNLGDVATVDWSAVDSVEVLTGGFPCQDLSLAGRRLGLRPDTRSGLWEHMAYAVDQLRPALVVIENVRGLLSARAHRNLGPDGEGLDDPGVLRALGAVLGDLADLGYDAAWQGVRAADVGAPHGRFRVFVCAWPQGPVDGRGDRPAAPDTGGEAGTLRPGLRADVAAGLGRARPDDGAAPAPDTDRGAGRRRAAVPLGGPAGGAAAHRDRAGGDRRAPAADTGRWGPYAAAVDRWERILGRPAPDPIERRSRGGRGLNPAFAEWMMGLPAGWVTEVPVADADQLDLFAASGSDRWALTGGEAIKALGNGVVPQQAAAAVAHLLSTAAPLDVLEQLGLADELAA